VPKRNQHVAPARNGWGVRAAGSPKATKIFPTKEDAILAAQEFVRKNKNGSEIFVHERDGRIHERLS